MRASIQESARVFIVTDFPPMFAPVITVEPGFSSMLTGTKLLPFSLSLLSSIGFTMPDTLIVSEFLFMPGIMPPDSAQSFAFAMA